MMEAKRAQREQNWLESKTWLEKLQVGEEVILLGESRHIIARRLKVERITTTGKVVVEGRHYCPETGSAETRRGWLEKYSPEKWEAMQVAAAMVTDGWRAC